MLGLLFRCCYGLFVDQTLRRRLLTDTWGLRGFLYRQREHLPSNSAFFAAIRNRHTPFGMPSTLSYQPRL